MTIDPLTPAAIQRTDEYRRRKRAAVLAILFTDLENSTGLRERLGEQAYEVLREEHDGVLSRSITAEDGGAVVASTGDGVLAVFSEPSTAVSRALVIQQALHHHPLLRVRVGIDTGQVSEERAGGIVVGVFGRHVNRAARIQALAKPTHVLTSFQVYDCAVGWLLSTGIRWHNHGMVRLKGFDVQLWQKLYQPPTRFALAATPSGDQAEVPRWQDKSPNELSLILSQVSTLLGRSRRRASLLWVDAAPEGNAVIRRWMEEAGCQITLVGSTDEAKPLVARQRYNDSNYYLGISDLGENPTNRLRLFREHGVPGIVFASVQDVAHYRVTGAPGVVLCTSGTASLLNGVYECLAIAASSGEL